MSGVRAWVLLACSLCFLAGLAAGVLLAPRFLPPPPERGPLHDFEQALVETFGLEPERADALHVILANYQRDRDELLARLPGELEPELVKLSLTYDDWIRDRVLPPGRRTEYDRWAQGLSSAASQP